MIFVILFSIVHFSHSSAGDRSQFFVNCMKGCRHNNCTEGKRNSIYIFNGTL